MRHASQWCPVLMGAPCAKAERVHRHRVLRAALAALPACGSFPRLWLVVVVVVVLLLLLLLQQL